MLIPQLLMRDQSCLDGEHCSESKKGSTTPCFTKPRTAGLSIESILDISSKSLLRPISHVDALRFDNVRRFRISSTNSSISSATYSCSIASRLNRKLVATSDADI